MRNRKVLIVEDDLNDVKLMKASIADSDLQIQLDFVDNGRDALNYLFQKEKYENSIIQLPDFIILDLNLPLMNGFEVLEEIRNNKNTRFIPVIGFSSSTYDVDVNKCYELGINSYVAKPMDFVNYKKTVSKMIQFWVDINQPPHL